MTEGIEFECDEGEVLAVPAMAVVAVLTRKRGVACLSLASSAFPTDCPRGRSGKRGGPGRVPVVGLPGRGSR